MYNWAGKFSFLLILFSNLVCHGAKVPGETTNWKQFEKEVALQREEDRKDGISYIISGSLALAGGLVGESISKDPSEGAIYSVFQTIGVASVGYGAYKLNVGGEDFHLLKQLSYTKLTDSEKFEVLKASRLEKKERQKSENSIRAITHSLIAALNIYNGSRQKNESLKTALYFIGGANILAAASFTFEF